MYCTSDFSESCDLKFQDGINNKWECVEPTSVCQFSEPTAYPTRTPSRSPLQLGQTHPPTTAKPTKSPTLSPTEDGIYQCLLPGHSIHAWYDGSSMDLPNRVWRDKSGNNLHGVVSENAGIDFFNGSDATNTELHLNGQPIVMGTYQTEIVFPVAMNPVNHTVFNLAKYREGASNKGRILQTDVDNSLFGFHSSRSGVAYYNYWITDAVDNFGENWVLQIQQQQYARSNFIDLTKNTQTQSSTTDNKLLINDGRYSSEDSDWAMAELIVSNDILDLSEIECIEDYFVLKYDYFRPATSSQNETDQIKMCLANGNKNKIIGLYNGDSISIQNNIWMDISGYGNHGSINVPTGLELFNGTDTTNTELYLNGHPVVTGTSETEIVFHAPLNPQSHTVFNLAKYRDGASSKGRILQTDLAYSFFGFYGSRSGVAYFDNVFTDWIDSFGEEWVSSTQQPQLYRGNFMSLTKSETQPIYSTNIDRLMINHRDARYSGEDSDWAMSELIVIDAVLNFTEIECVEQYLQQKYDLYRPIEPPQTTNKTTAPK